MTPAIWMNRRTGNLREGEWTYYWPSDRFSVAIKGLPFRHVWGDEPQWGDWVFIGNL